MAWLAAVGAIAGAASSARQGQQAKVAAEYNAKLDEQQAAASASASYRDEETQRRAAGQLKGKQRAAIAASGGGYGGSNGLLMDQSDAAAELDALNIRYGGQLRSQGLLSNAKMTRLQGGNARSQANLQAGGQLLRGASDTYSNYRINKAG
jgi:hypothetical protein